MDCEEYSIGRRLKRINNALDRRRTLELQAQELTSSQAFLLGYLHHNRDRAVYAGEIVEAFGLKHSTVSGILQRLEAKGFIVYGAAEDRRRKQILLTQKAMDVHSRIEQMLEENERLITTSMNPTQQQTLRQLLDLVLQNISADTPTCCPFPKEGSDV